MKPKKNSFLASSVFVIFAAAPQFTLHSNEVRADDASSIDLSDSSLMETEMTRKILEYTVQCALPEGAVASAEHKGVLYEFFGVMGIAPEWINRALSNAEQSDVTACLLARTNAFGVPVQISLRSEYGALADLHMFNAGRDEQKEYSIWEGAFFGNIFDPKPEAYTCTGAEGAIDVLRAARRICTLPTDQVTAEGYPVSACGFIVLGSCNEVLATQLGQSYADHMVHVYLPDPDRKQVQP